MADFTRNQPADFVNRTTDDNNVKIVSGADPPSIVIGPEGDEFGDTFDLANWSIIGGSVTEASGLLQFDDPGLGGAGSARIERTFDYLDWDIETNWSDTNFLNTGAGGYHSSIWLRFQRATSLVYIYYLARAPANFHSLVVQKNINGVVTTLLNTINFGNHNAIKFRIQRIASTSTFTFYYDTGGGWVSAWSGVIFDATHLNTTQTLKPRIRTFTDAAHATPFEPENNWYRQDNSVVAYQRFWPDSPESLIIKSDDGAVEYFEDAGDGFFFELTGASVVQDEDGGTNKYKVGYSDDGVAATATYDATWQTAAEVDTNAAAGNYDDHRYLHVKTQLNSDGTQENEITSFTLSGAKVSAGIASDVFESAVFGSKVFGRA